MSDYNHCALLGRLTRDPEKFEFSGGTGVKFGLASNERYRTRDGEDVEKVLFVDCVMCGRGGDVIAQHVSKGDPLLVSGRLQLDQWESREGEKRSRITLNVRDFSFLPRAKPDGGGQRKEQSRRDDIRDDDIPF